MKTRLTSTMRWAVLGGLRIALLLSTTAARADVLDNWTTNQVSTNYFRLECVVYGNGRYVAYGWYSDYGVIMSSEEGKNWTLRSDGAGPSPSFLSYSLDLIYTGGRFFALGGFGTSGVSSNGIDWTVLSGNLGSALGVTYGASKYVAVGDVFNGAPSGDDFNVYTSPDGVTWTARHSTSPNSASLGDIAFGAGIFVALGINSGSVNDSGHTYTSTTGNTWTQRTIPGGSQISFNNGIFIVPYVAGTNLISANGISWAAVNTGITNKLGKVTFANGLFMAKAGNSIATSTDGTNWVQYAQGVPGGMYIATDGSRLVTVGGTPGGDVIHYNGFTYTSDVLVGIRLTNTSPSQIVLSGLVGRSYRVEFTDALSTTNTNNWQTLTNLQLPITPCILSDPTATNTTRRFYRAVLLP